MKMADLQEFARRYTEAWCSAEPGRVAEFYSPEGFLRVNEGEAAVGREAITAVAAGFMSAFPDMVVAFDGLREADGKTEYHWTLTGTNTGPGGTGRRVEISGFETWTMGGDGLIAASEGRFDAAEYQRQLDGR